MKKLFFCMACVGLLAVSAWAVDEKNVRNEKITDIAVSPVSKAAGNIFNGKKVYYLDGFGKDYKKGDPGIDAIVKAEVQATKNGVKDGVEVRVTPPAANKPYYSVIGHSQGGLRALSYISELKRQRPNEVNNIDAVITISGIDQGLKALDGGLPQFKKRITEKVKIVENGVRAGAGVFDFGGLATGVIPRSMLSNAIDFFLYIIPAEFSPYWLAAWGSPHSSEYQQLHDMVPGSSYITKNVVKTKDHKYRKKTGTKTVVELRIKMIALLPIVYPWVGKVDVYSTYTAQEAIPQFDSSVPVGFIAGLDSKTINMSEDPQKIRDGIGKARTAFEVIRKIHLGKNIFLFGMLSGGLTYQADANRAEILMANIDSELNDLKGSSQNDGLVALESQYIPQTFKDPNTGKIRKNLNNPVLGKRIEGYVGMPKYNHQNITKMAETFQIANEMIKEGQIERGR